MKFISSLILLSIFLFLGCSENNSRYKQQLGVSKLPKEHPIVFKQELTPEGKLIHRGILSPDLENYYFTISDTTFQNFDIYVSQLDTENSQSKSEKVFFNSEYDDHGMSFSPDGKTLFFSSTRPVENYSVAATWHIWKSENKNGKWTEPEYVDIPNLRQKLASHPSISNDGTLYFHASNTDYSEMDLFYANLIDGQFQPAQKIKLSDSAKHGRTTPYIVADGSLLIYAAVNESLDLMVAHRNENGKWDNAEKLSKSINTNGQGNPFVTLDNKFLFYASEDSGSNWSIRWVSVESFFPVN